MNDTAHKPFAWPGGTQAALSLTFDDARPSQPERCLPILDRYGVKATFYVSVGTSLRQHLGAWKAAVANGHEIGNHTMTHPCSGNFEFSRHNALEDYTIERMERELLDANDRIRELLGVTPRTFAYPCGQTFVGRGDGVRSYIPLVAEHFIAARGGFDEVPSNPAACDLVQLTGVEADCRSITQLRALVAQAVQSGGWLILFAHEVADANIRQTLRAGVLDLFCAEAAGPGSRVWVDTVQTVAEYVIAAREIHLSGQEP